VFFDWDQHSNCEQPSDSKVASEQCTGFLHLALAVKQSSTVKAAGMRAVQIGVYSTKSRFKSKLKWRWVRFAANACGGVIMMWDMRADPRKLTATSTIRSTFLWIIGAYPFSCLTDLFLSFLVLGYINRGEDVLRFSQTVLYEIQCFVSACVGTQCLTFLSGFVS